MRRTITPMLDIERRALEEDAPFSSREERDQLWVENFDQNCVGVSLDSAIAWLQTVVVRSTCS